MNKEKIIIYALVAFVAYHLFIKEGFEVQKTRCSSYPIPQLCVQYKSKGCDLNPNKVAGDNQDLCICKDPSKGCDDKPSAKPMTKQEILKRMLEIQEAKLAPIRNSYNDLMTSRKDWENEKNETLKTSKYNTVVQKYNTYISLKPGAGKGGLPNDPDVIILNQGVQKDGKFKFASDRSSLFAVLGNEYKDLYTKYENMIRRGM